MKTRVYCSTANGTGSIWDTNGSGKAGNRSLAKQIVLAIVVVFFLVILILVVA
jgi:hypothetical protein